MSTLQVTTVTSPDANTPLILTTGNTSGGQIVLQAANTDIQMQGNFKFSNTNFAGDLSFGGNVGIGVTSTTSKLEVAGNTLTGVSGVGGRYSVRRPSDGAVAAYVGFHDANNTNFGIYSGSGGAQIQMKSDGGFIVATEAGTERMRVDASGNLGLGISPSPWSTNFRSLEILNQGSGIAAASSSGYVYTVQNCYQNTSGNWTYKYSANSSMFVAQNTGFAWYLAPSGTAGGTVSFTQAMTLDPSGNLNLNDIYNRGGLLSMTRSQSGSPSYANMISLRDGGAGNVMGFRSYGDPAAGTAWQTYFSGAYFSVYDTVASAERMRIDSNGNVGINYTYLNAAKVTINAGTSANGNSLLLENIDGTYNPYMQIQHNSNGVFLNFSSSSGSTASAFNVSINDSQKMRMDATGNLLIGSNTNVSLGGNTPRLALVSDQPQQLYCKGAGSGYTQSAIVLASDTASTPEGRGIGTYLFNEGTDVTWYMGTFYGSADVCGFARTTGTTFQNSAASSGNYRLYSSSAGDLYILGSYAQKASGTAWANPSDVRLKRDIADYEKGLDELSKIRVRKWKFNGKGGTVDGTDAIGVIADEVMTVLPETVTEYSVKLNPDDETETMVKRFDATEITWLLVKAVQELKAEIETLKGN